jgi:DnaJ-class molecular chaperone
MSSHTTPGLREALLTIMRRMDCQDLFDDAFHALVQYERSLRSLCPWCQGSGKPTHPGDIGNDEACARCEGAGTLAAAPAQPGADQ